MPRSILLLAIACLTCNSFAQNKTDQAKITRPQASAEASPDSSSRLPVKRVVLYKNGVGYFEHTAHVTTSGSARPAPPSEH